MRFTLVCAVFFGYGCCGGCVLFLFFLLLLFLSLLLLALHDSVVETIAPRLLGLRVCEEAREGLGSIVCAISLDMAGFAFLGFRCRAEGALLAYGKGVRELVGWKAESAPSTLAMWV